MPQQNPDGFIRVETEARLVELLNTLDGFTATKNNDLWMAVPAGSFTSTKLPNRKLVVIGTSDGAFEREGMQAGAGPGVDVWDIPCGLVCTTIRNPIEAKQACQDALNTIADEFARDHRLGMVPGPHEVAVINVDGPWFGLDTDQVPTAWINFDVNCSAHIRRNPS